MMASPPKENRLVWDGAGFFGGLVGARHEGVLVRDTHTPPPPSSLYEYQRKGLIEKAVCKLLRIKRRFAQRLHRGALRRSEGVVPVWGKPTHTPPTSGV